MQRFRLCLLMGILIWLSPLPGQAQGTLFFLDGGIQWPRFAFDEPSRAPALSPQPGYYFGFSGLVLPRKENRPMFQAHTGLESTAGEWFVRLRPGISYLPDLGGGFHLHGHLGMSAHFPLHNGFRTYISLDPELGLGYRGVILKGGYQWGLTRWIDPSLSSTGLPGTRGRVHQFYLGLSFSPQVLFPSSAQTREFQK